MNQRTYRATFAVEVEITVPEIAIRRVLDNHDDWRQQFYDLDERGVIEMLARCCGIYGSRLHQLDGWADIKPEQGSSPEGRIVSCDLEDYRREESKP